MMTVKPTEAQHGHAVNFSRNGNEQVISRGDGFKQSNW